MIAVDKLCQQTMTKTYLPSTKWLLVCRRLAGAFRGWSQAVDKLCQQTLADGCEDLTQQVGSMKAENDRLRRDNERFVRLIDSGEWGRGRVAELTQAGESLLAPAA